MPKREFLPALRQALGMETKSLSITRYGGLPARLTTYGRRDAAAGWDLDTVIQDGYERIVWVYRAVEIIAGNASRLPFKITANDDSETIENHPLLRVMNKRANPLENGRAFRKRLSAQVLLSKKGAFVEVTKNRAGQISRLDLLDPNRVRIVPSLDGDYISYFEYTTYDGELRPLPPERVRWVRDNHPLDPFSGTTPLDAAGMSVELDHLARAYNVSFINNDGRPGGILGVDTEGISDGELDRIESRIKPGAHYAGGILPLGTGKGGLSYVDTSARPRDMAYETLSSTAKAEILAAFNVPLSMAGDASARTFDNAEQEEFNFWHDPMLPHLDLIASAFDGDVDDDMDCGFDTSGVDALELPARRRRQEEREEFDKGLRSIREYRDGRPELEKIDNPQTRALWVSPAKAPIPGAVGDEAALGLDDGMGGGMGGGPAAPPPVGPDGQPEAQTAAELVAQARAEGADEDALPVVPEGEAASLLQQARAEQSAEPVNGEASALVEAARMEGKVLDPSKVRIVDAPQEYDPGDDEQRKVELTIGATLNAYFARQAGVIAARLESPKARRGTPYWTPENDQDTRVGDESINTEKVVDAARWAGEMQEALRPVLTPAAKDSAEGLLTSMAAAGALVVATGTAADVAGRTLEAPKATAEQVSAYAARAAAAPIMLALVTALDALNDWLGERTIDLDQLAQEHTGSLPNLIEQTKRLWADKAATFADSLAVTLSQTVVSGGRDAAVVGLAPQTPPTGLVYPAAIDRFWRTRHDERVRETHREADGQMRQVGDSFDVGGYDVRFPSDPLAPASVARWCRCWLSYEWPADAEFVVPTEG